MKPLTKKQRRRIMCALELRKRKHTPLVGNICQDCPGEVVKKVVSVYREQFQYGTPECMECGRVYVYAEHVRPVGAEEFQKLLNTPCTI